MDAVGLLRVGDGRTVLRPWVRGSAARYLVPGDVLVDPGLAGKAEHPLGRACDGTFGNSIGTAATGPALETGWTVTTWLKDNAQALGVQYLIWQGRIWSVARSDEGWRPYGGGGMHDPGDVTGGHYDHLHITIAGFL